MLDPAASEFFEDGSYVFRKSDQRRLSSDEIIAVYKEWLRKYPEIWSLEDGIAEEDNSGWRKLTTQLGDTIQLVGDDNFVTNPEIFRRGIEEGIANSILIKLNQIGHAHGNSRVHCARQREWLRSRDFAPLRGNR